MNNGGFNNNNKNNTNNKALAVFELYKMDEIVTITELYDAYLECRKKKRGTIPCADFELNEAANLYELYLELNSRGYKIGQSDAFCVTRPKDREIFAAAFRDRIVHHLLIRKIGDYFEAFFDDESYNCRKGKGNLYGAKRLQAQMLEMPPGAYCARLDLQGFFMSIHKPTLCRLLESFIREWYKGEDVEFWVSLALQIANHRPELNCRIKGRLDVWKRLPANKSLFTNNDDCGLAIGNLTSQIFANFYLTYLDKFVRAKFPRIKYGRYVDDVYLLAETKEEILEAIPQIRALLVTELRVTLHPYKVYLQPISHGMGFIGFYVKDGRLYTGNRTISHLYDLIRFQRVNAAKADTIERFTRCYNSQVGFLVHTYSYNIRCRAWYALDAKTKEYLEQPPWDFSKIRPLPQYTITNQLKNLVLCTK